MVVDTNRLPCRRTTAFHYVTVGSTTFSIDIVFFSRSTITRSSTNGSTTAAVFGGGKHTWRLQLKFQLAKKDGEWKFILASASTY